MRMRFVRLAFILLAATPLVAVGQRDSVRAPRDSTARPSTAAAVIRPDATRPGEERTVTQHSVTIGGTRIDYDATFGSIVLRNAADEPMGSVYYTAYTKRGVGDRARRPITFAYNGGPGSSSVASSIGT